MMSTEPTKAKLKFLANLDQPLVYIPSQGGGDATDHVGNFVMQEVDVHDARRELPTSSLDAQEVKQLFSVMEKLRDQGISIIFITRTEPPSLATFWSPVWQQSKLWYCCETACQFVANYFAGY